MAIRFITVSFYAVEIYIEETEMARKEYNLPEQTIDAIHEVMKETGFKYEVDAVIFMINEYNEYRKRDLDLTKYSEMTADLVTEKLDKHFTRLRLGLRTAEQNSIIMKDITNTLLFKLLPSKNEMLMPAEGRFKHTVLVEAEDNLSEKIAKAKQEKDNLKAQRGIE
jgi:hypothetical protein